MQPKVRRVVAEIRFDSLVSCENARLLGEMGVRFKPYPADTPHGLVNESDLDPAPRREGA